jgi:hypothetical protein
MKNVLALGFFTHALFSFVLSPVVAQTPTPPPTATLAPSPEPTPTRPLRDTLTEVLPDRHVTFRLFAPRADSVAVIIGVKIGPNEPRGSATAAMTKNANGLWICSFLISLPAMTIETSERMSQGLRTS